MLMSKFQSSYYLAIYEARTSDRGPGRPHKSWQDCVREDPTTLRMQHIWNEIAQDRERWRSIIHNLFEIPGAHLAYGLESE